MEQAADQTSRINIFQSIFTLPKDTWGHVIQYLHEYDVIFLRATNALLYRFCNEYRRFSKYSVLDQEDCMKYLAKNGFTSCLDYVRDTLRFEWTENLLRFAARSGFVDVLKHLTSPTGLKMDLNRILLECTKGTCDLSMIKYLRECGAPWNQTDLISPFLVTPFSRTRINFYNRNLTIQTVMENMAYHGHLDCMKYAIENGCEQRSLMYTPSIECLDFAIRNGFDWTGGAGSFKANSTTANPVKLSICEEAAKLGDLTILKYAHQNGAALNRSAVMALITGHLNCLLYASEHGSDLTTGSHFFEKNCKTLDCFKFMVQEIGLEVMQNQAHIWSKQLTVGNIDTLRYMLANNFKLPKPHTMMLQMIQSEATKSLDIMKFMLDEAKMTFNLVNPYIYCAQHGNIEGMQFLKNRNFPVDFIPEQPLFGGFIISGYQIVLNALTSKKIEVVKFVWDHFNVNGVDSSDECLNCAVIYSTPEILDFLTQYGVKWTSKHLAAAADAGNFANLAFLTRFGCQWNDEVCTSTNAMCVKYAREHGCTNINNARQ